MNHTHRYIDPVHNTIRTASSTTTTRQRAEQGLAHDAVRVQREWPGTELQDSRRHGLGQGLGDRPTAGERKRTSCGVSADGADSGLGRPDSCTRAAAGQYSAHGVQISPDLAPGELFERLGNPGARVGIGQDLEGQFQSIKVIDIDDHDLGDTVAGNRYTLVLSSNPARQFAEPGLASDSGSVVMSTLMDPLLNDGRKIGLHRSEISPMSIGGVPHQTRLRLIAFGRGSDMAGRTSPSPPGEATGSANHQDRPGR
jgi:hypothetical protein